MNSKSATPPSQVALPVSELKWVEEEFRILRGYFPSEGKTGVQDRLREAGYQRTMVAIQAQAYRLELVTDHSFRGAMRLPQQEFFKRLSGIYLEGTGQKLTYKKLAEMCYVSHSRVQKWFAPGNGQEPLSDQLKHHFWLACIDARRQLPRHLRRKADRKRELAAAK